MPSDLIYREDAKDFVRHAYHKGLNPIDYLDEVPAADVVEVVRCKDCQHYNPEATEWRCDMVTGLVEPYDDDFCSYGERRAETK